MLTTSEIDKIYKKCLEPSTEDRITAVAVYNYLVSPFMVYCEKFVPEEKKDPITQYQQLLFNQGKEHEMRVIETKFPEAKIIEYVTAEEGFKLLLEAINEGEKVIYGMPVFYLPEGLAGRIDILERRDTAPSIFRSYHYVVKEIKLAKNIRQHHTFQAAFYNYILGKIQGFTSPVFYLINRDFEEYEENYDEDELLEKLNDIREILKGKEVSPTFGACEWPWETFNNEEAIMRRDISLLSGLGPSKKQVLVNIGICTIDDIVNTPQEKLVEIKGIRAKTAKKFILKSKALISGECIPIGTCNFPEKSTDIFLDLEGTGAQIAGEELIEIDYLIGVVLRKEGKDEYIPFIAHKKDKEGEMFQQFLDWLEKQDDFIIYYWHSYERTHLKKMSERYGIKDKIEKLLFDNMRDISKDAVRCFAFPTYSNGLKEIASYIGYEWKHEEVNATEAIVMYLKYAEEPDKNKDEFQKVIDYNEDDCRATMLIKDFLKKNMSSKFWKN